MGGAALRELQDEVYEEGVGAAADAGEGDGLNFCSCVPTPRLNAS